ncbi:hypothetical protein, partial [Helicobacter marmotae]
SLLSAKESLSKTPKSTTSDSDRDSSVVSLPQNDKLCYPQGKPTHNKHLQRKLLCHSERYGESLHKATRQSLSYCHSERSEESLPESLVALFSDSKRKSLVYKRDSSPAMQALDMTMNPAFTRNPKSNASQKAHRDSSPFIRGLE